jgi:hypothetical protein
MGKYYLDLPFIGEIPAAYRQDAQQIMAVTGLNIGNFAFRHALRFIVADLAAHEPVGYPAYHAAAAAGRVEQTLVSCANWLGTSAQDESSNLNRARTFAATGARTVCFGLGVQAKSDGGLPELGPNTLQLARVLADHAPLLSLRDELTRATLAAAGITNTVVTGCPSNFINPDPDLGAQIAARARALAAAAPGWSALRSLVSEFSGGHAASGQVLRAVLRLLASSPAFYVVQSPTLMPLLLRESDEIPPAYRANSPFGRDTERLRAVLRGRTLHFTAIEAWMDFARTCDLSFGMRIHGTMLPLQAGVPAALISHDARTAGLAGEMGIPQIPAEAFSIAEGPQRMLEEIARVMDGYDARRRELARVMVDYLTTNGLAPHPALAGLAGLATDGETAATGTATGTATGAATG